MALSAENKRREQKLLRSTLNEMQDAQWYDAARLADYQSALLGPLLKWAKLHVPLYAERFGDRSSAELAELGVGQIGTLPILTRADVRDHQVELESDELPRGHGKPIEVTSSGSTGAPIRVLMTSYSQLWAMGYHMRDHYWHQRDLSGTLAAIRPAKGSALPPMGDRGPTWGKAVGLLHETGPSRLLEIACDIPVQVEFLRRVAPDYLLTFPTNVQAIALHCLEHGIRLDSLREIRTLSEALPDDLRELVREAFGVPIADVYSCRELASLAIQCPEHEHYHVSAENVVLEVLDDDDQPCEPGEVGRVVVTGLRGFATPLIRYELGDYARVGPPCDCGRGLPVLERILGRTRNRIKLPNGTTTYARTGYQLLGERVLEVRQIQFVQNQLDRIDVKIVAEHPLTPEHLEALLEFWRENFYYPFEFDIQYVDAIPRSAGGKFEDIICNV